MTTVTQPRSKDLTVRIRVAALQDQRISRRARGLLAELMSRPAGWKTSAEGLARVGPEGRDAMRAALIELEDAGYLTRTRTRSRDGRVHGVTWELSDVPSTPRRLRPTADFQPPVDQPPVHRRSVDQPSVDQPPTDQPPPRQPRRGLETEVEDTPPPTPAVTDLSEVRATALARVVVEEIDGKAPKPSSGVLTAACRRLLAEGWTDDELRAAVRARAWTGAGAGAVVSFVRALGPEDRSSAAQKPARKRPDWCGACDEASRLVTDAQSGRPRRCPDCHPLATKARRTP